MDGPSEPAGSPDPAASTDGNGETAGTFVVTYAESASAVLQDVDGGQVHTLSENPGVAAGDVLEATLAPDPPLEVTWRVVDVDRRRSVTVEESPEPPTEQAREIAAGQDVGELTKRERAGEGEFHVLTVPSDEAAAAVEDVVGDEATLARAARMSAVTRVEVRSAPGVVSVRYLP